MSATHRYIHDQSRPSHVTPQVTVAPVIRIVPHINSITDDVRCLFWNKRSNCFHNGLKQTMPAKRSRSQFMEDGAMDKKEVAKMLGYLKYHKGSNETAAKALDTYNGLAPSEKRSFLAQFAKNEKDLSWTHTFSDSTTVSTGDVSKIKERWFNRNEILRMNALDNAEMTEQEKDALCQSLIDQSHQEFDHAVQTAEHPNKLLTKFFYRKALGSDNVTSTTKSSSLQMSTTGQSLGQLALQSEPSPSVSIKIECPITATVKKYLVTLRTGKSALERKLNEGRDLEAALTIKCGKDAALTSKLAEVTMAMSRLDQFLAELRAILAEVKLVMKVST